MRPISFFQPVIANPIKNDSNQEENHPSTNKSFLNPTISKFKKVNQALSHWWIGQVHQDAALAASDILDKNVQNDLSLVNDLNESSPRASSPNPTIFIEQVSLYVDQLSLVSRDYPKYDADDFPHEDLPTSIQNMAKVISNYQDLQVDLSKLKDQLSIATTLENRLNSTLENLNNIKSRIAELSPLDRARLAVKVPPKYFLEIDKLIALVNQGLSKVSTKKQKLSQMVLEYSQINTHYGEILDNHLNDVKTKVNEAITKHKKRFDEVRKSFKELSEVFIELIDAYSSLYSTLEELSSWYSKSMKQLDFIASGAKDIVRQLNFEVLPGYQKIYTELSEDIPIIAQRITDLISQETDSEGKDLIFKRNNLSPLKDSLVLTRDDLSKSTQGEQLYPYLIFFSILIKSSFPTLPQDTHNIFLRKLVKSNNGNILLFKELVKVLSKIKITGLNLKPIISPLEKIASQGEKLNQKYKALLDNKDRLEKKVAQLEKKITALSTSSKDFINPDMFISEIQIISNFSRH